MSDIVERLEYTAKHGLTKAADAHRYASHAEARDEIVRLRAEVEEARANSMSNWGQRERAVAAEAERDRLRDALVRVLAWAEAVAGDNRFIAEAAEEIASVEQARAALGDTQ